MPTRLRRDGLRIVAGFSAVFGGISACISGTRRYQLLSSQAIFRRSERLSGRAGNVAWPEYFHLRYRHNRRAFTAIYLIEVGGDVVAINLEGFFWLVVVLDGRYNAIVKANHQ